MGHIALIAMLVYVISPLFTGRVNPEDAARESKLK
jgi:hypothetical protein